MSDNPVWDLNIFFREDWSEEQGTTWSDVLYINPLVYTHQHKRYTDMLWETTPEETKIIQGYFPESEYGSDWCVFADLFLETAPPRLASLVRSLPELPLLS